MAQELVKPSPTETDRQPGDTRRAIVLSVALPVAALVIVTAAMLVFRARLDKAHVAMLYLLVVLGGSVAGRVAGLGIATAAFLLFNFLFLPPYNTFAINDPLDWLVLLSFLVTSVVAAELLNRQRVQARLAEARGTELEGLATLGAETLNAARAENALHAIARVIRSSIGAGRCELFVRAGATGLRSIADTGTTTEHSGAESLLAYVAESGRAAVARADGTVSVVGTLADVTTELEGVHAFAMPLTVRSEIVGVLRISTDSGLALTSDQHRVLNALAYYAALAIERLRLERAEEATEELRRVDRLKDSLLAAVSHDLRTPLTTIKGMAHEIAAEGSERARLIEHEADQLSLLVDGLLELSQLNAHAVPIQAELNTADELVGAALRRAASALKDRVVAVTHAQEDMLVGRFDFAHSLRILVNLLDNASKYSPQGSPIEVRINRAGNQLEIAVSDSGPGIPENEQARIFEPFNRSLQAPSDVRGAGLGLSISRQLAEAQGGALSVKANPDGGSVFTLTLPGENV